MDWKDIIVRALKTGGQAAIAALFANFAAFGSVTDWDSLKASALTIGMAVGSAFVSAVWNVILQAIQQKEE